ncbi:MAG: hypothetical protein B6I35_11910 [Anaerolineaceae bacterium 4572_32.2]|nr:MAG: hypothetical protein B6I35_11910 [Anaerolineaceae bacterium 4572_32.2]
MRQKAGDFPRPGQTVWQHQMPREQSPQRDAIFVQRQIAYLPVHLLHGRLVDGRIALDFRVPASRYLVRVLYIRHVNIHHAI